MPKSGYPTHAVMASVDIVRVYEFFKDFITENSFKKGRVCLILDVSSTVLERRESIIEGTWDAWVSHPEGLFLKEAHSYDRVELFKGGYTSEQATPEYSGKIEIRNRRRKGTVFVSAHSIHYMELAAPSK